MCGFNARVVRVTYIESKTARCFNHDHVYESNARHIFWRVIDRIEIHRGTIFISLIEIASRKWKSLHRIHFAINEYRIQLDLIRWFVRAKVTHTQTLDEKYSTINIFSQFRDRIQQSDTHTHTRRKWNIYASSAYERTMHMNWDHSLTVLCVICLVLLVPLSSAIRFNASLILFLFSATNIKDNFHVLLSLRGELETGWLAVSSRIFYHDRDPSVCLCMYCSVNNNKIIGCDLKKLSRLGICNKIRARRTSD